MERALRHKLPQGRFVTTATRSRQMAAVKSSGNKSTESRLRAALISAGVSGWQMAPRNIVGKPDFYFPKQRLAVFVDGCFWHGCPKCGHIPGTNRLFWRAKILGNRFRDRRINAQFRIARIQVVRFWEHQLRTHLSTCVARLIATLENSP